MRRFEINGRVVLASTPHELAEACLTVAVLMHSRHLQLHPRVEVWRVGDSSEEYYYLDTVDLKTMDDVAYRVIDSAGRWFSGEGRCLGM